MPNEIDTPIEYTSFLEFTVKALDDAPGRFEGYASTWDKDRQGDIILYGAFDSTLKSNKGKVPILFGHLSSRIVGFGLDAEQDTKGLKVIGEFTMKSDDGRNAYEIAKHAGQVGAKLGLSIGYGIRRDGAEWNEQTGIRTLKDLDLFEYSLAAVPANPRASIGRVKHVGDLRQLLQRAGFSEADAREFISLARPSEAVERKQSDARPSEGQQATSAAQQDLLAAIRSLDLTVAIHRAR